jgi:hypothetical protein
VLHKVRLVTTVDRVDSVIDRPCTIAELSVDTGGGCPAVVTIALDAIAFESVTASARATVGDASATIATAITSGRIDIF